MWAQRKIQQLDDLSDPIVAKALVGASLASIVALAVALFA